MTNFILQHILIKNWLAILLIVLPNLNLSYKNKTQDHCLINSNFDKSFIIQKDTTAKKFQNFIDDFVSVLDKNQVLFDSIDALNTKKLRFLDTLENLNNNLLLEFSNYLNGSKSLLINPFNEHKLAQDIQKHNELIRENLIKIQTDSTALINLSNGVFNDMSNALQPIRNYIKNSNGWLSFSFRGKELKVFIADNEHHEINLHLLDKHNKSLLTFGHVQQLLEENNNIPLMITNAGMFQKNFMPVGLYIDSKSGIVRQLEIPSKPLNDNFHLYPNGVFYIDKMGKMFIEETNAFYEKFGTDYSNIKLATQSGPMLIIDGIIHPSFKQNSSNKKTRSCVGILNESRAVFVLTAEPESFYQISWLLMQIFGCDNALYLDGEISEMYDISGKEICPARNFGPIISICKKSKI